MSQLWSTAGDVFHSGKVLYPATEAWIYVTNYFCCIVQSRMRVGVEKVFYVCGAISRLSKPVQSFVDEFYCRLLEDSTDRIVGCVRKSTD